VSAAPAADPQRARRLLLARRARNSRMVAGTSCLRGALVCLALLAGFQAAGAAPPAKLDVWSGSRPRARPDKPRARERRGAELRGAGAAAAERRVPVDAGAAGLQCQPGPERALQRARAARAAAAAVGRVRPSPTPYADQAKQCTPCGPWRALACTQLPVARPAARRMRFAHRRLRP